MKRALRALRWLGVALVAAAAALGGYVWVECARFDASMEKVYAVATPDISRSTDPAVIARGKHLAESVAGCAAKDCHGADFGGGAAVTMGPLGRFCGPNITSAGLGAAYSDGELARLIEHGIKKDGRSVRMMPSQDIAWLPEADVTAIVSFLRTVPGVDRLNGATDFRTLAKVLDRQDKLPVDVARRIDHGARDTAPSPAPTADYGRFLGRLCRGCHGERFSGGPLPGAPSTLAVPLNLTRHPTGLEGWTFADFDRTMRQAIRKNGRPLDPFMPVEAWKNLDQTEMHALWAYLQSLPPVPLGNR